MCHLISKVSSFFSNAIRSVKSSIVAIAIIAASTLSISAQANLGSATFTVLVPAGTTSVAMHSNTFNWNPSHANGVATANADGTWSVTVTRDAGYFEFASEYLWIVDGEQESLFASHAASECGTNELNTDGSTYANRNWTAYNDDLANNVFDVYGACDESESVAVFDGSFGGIVIDGYDYTYPASAEVWAGVANNAAGLYPFSFPDGGYITFTAQSLADTSVYFKFEDNPNPNNTLDFSTASVVVGQDTYHHDYAVAIPPQGAQTFNSFLMYINERDQVIDLQDVRVFTTQPAAAPVLKLTVAVPDGTSTVSINGPWWTWNGSGLVGTDNGDGTWTVEMAPGATDMEYLWVVDGVQEDLTTSDFSCTPITDNSSYANRVWTLDSGDVTDDNFGTCDAPAAATPPAAPVLKLTVAVPDGTSTVSINGPWWTWNGSGLVGTDNGDGTWTVEMAPGATDMEYLWVVDGVQEDLTTSDFSCTPITDNSSYANRIWTLDSGDVTDDNFGTCDAPAAATPPAAPVLKLTVAVPDGTSTVSINGPWWTWNGSGLVGTDNGDGTWTVEMAPGATDMEYLWVVDGVQEDLTTSDFSCTPITDNSSYANRVWTLDSGDVTGDNFGTCDAPAAATIPDSPTPSESASEVLSIFSSTYGNIAGANFDVNWGETTDLTVGNVLTYENLNYQGTTYPSQDVWAYQYLNVDFYTDDSTALEVFLISPGTENAVSLTADIVVGQWVSVEIPLSSYTADLALVSELKVQGNGTVLLDNIYFGGASGLSAPAPATPDDYCAATVTHFLSDAEVASAALLTVESVDANNVDVSITSADSDPIDLLIIGAQEDAASAVGAMTLDNGTATIRLTYDNGAPASTKFEVLWSKVSQGGNSMVRPGDYPAPINMAATCGGNATPPAAPVLKLTVAVPDGTSTVSINGPWWTWNGSGLVGTDNGDGTWTVEMAPGATDMEYLWVVDGVQEDLTTSDFSCTPITDNSSYANRVWTLDSGDVTDDNFGTCDAPAAATPPAAPVLKLTVAVPDGTSTVSINGPWWTWNGSGLVGTDNGDGTWTVEMAPGATDMEYLWVVDGVQEDLTTSDFSCTPITDNSSYANRVWTLDSGDVTDDNFGTCDAPAAATPPAAPVLKLTVAVPDGTSTVSINGPWWTWNGSGLVGTDNGDGTWTVEMAPGATDMEYLWVVDGVQEDLTTSDFSCTPITDNSSYANRVWTLDSGDVTDDNFGTCDAPAAATPPAAPVLKLTVAVPDGTSTVSINGPWWTWNGSGLVGTDNGDGTWTVEMAPGATDMEYLWVVDGVQEDLTTSDFSCTPITDNSSYANRVWTLDSGDVTGDNFGTCDAPAAATIPDSPTPSESASEVLSIFSSTYGNIAGANFDVNWGETTDLTVGNVLTYENLNYQGTTYPSQDVWAYQYLNVDFYTDDSTALEVFLISPGTENAVSLTADIVVGQWVSVEIPLSSYTADLALVSELKVQGNGTVLLDNIYFGGASGLSAPAPATPDDYCAATVTHFLSDAEVASAALLTVESVDANNVDVSITSADSDPIDLLIIGAQEDAASAVGAMTLDNGTATIRLTYDNGAPASTKFEVLWSKVSQGGNSMVRPGDYPAPINMAATCGGNATPPAAPVLKLTVAVPDGTSTVSINGPWWTWNGSGLVGTDNGDGTWTVEMAPGATDMEYLWVVDGVQEDLTTSDFSCTPITDNSSYANRVWTLDSGDVTDDNFGTCDAPAAATPPAAPVLKLTVAVPDGTSTVSINGPWWTWNGSGLVGTDNGDGTWTVEMAPGATDMEYLWVVDGVQEDLTTSDFSCTPITDNSSYANRVWTLDSGDVTDDNFGTCDAPAAATPPAAPVLKLTVAVPDGTSTVSINGPWWTWNGSGLVGTDNGDGTWTVEMAPGATDMEYLWVVDGVQEDLTTSDFSCTPITDNSSYANRVWTLDSGDVTDDNFGTCDAPAAATPPAAPVLKLTVAVPDGTSTVSINGPWWTWNGSGLVGTDNGDGTWTVEMTPGATDMEYLWVVDGVQEDLTTSDFSCTPITDNSSYANRVWTLDSGDVTDDNFGTCDAPAAATPPAAPVLKLTVAVPDGTSTVSINGPWWTWNGSGLVGTDNGDGTWTVEMAPGATDMEYLWVVDGVQEDLTTSDFSCTPVTDNSSYANRVWTLDSGDVTGDNFGTCDDPAAPPANGGDTNLVTDGTFDESTSTTWTGNAYNPQNGVNEANVDAVGNAYAVNLSGTVDLTAGATYTLTFDVSGTEGRTILAGIGESGGSYHNHVETVTLTATSQAIVLHLTAKHEAVGADFGGATSRVIFDMGADLGAVNIDNVSLTAGHTGTENLGTSGNTTGGNTGGSTGSMEPVFDQPFDGTTLVNGVFNFPAGAQSHAGFINTNTAIYPIVSDTFKCVDFQARVPSGNGEPRVYFKLESNPWPNNLVSTTTPFIRISGSSWKNYSTCMTSTGDQQWNQLIFYISEFDRDEPLEMRNIELNWQLAVGGGNNTGGNTDPIDPPTFTLTNVADTVTAVRLVGPIWNAWDGTAGPEATKNADGTWSVTLDPAPTATLEYKWLIDGLQENLVLPAAAGECSAEIDAGSINTNYSTWGNRYWATDAGDITNIAGACAGTDLSPDTDGDGVPDVNDPWPNDSTQSVDTDGDGISNSADTDDDDDGVSDDNDPRPLDDRFTDITLAAFDDAFGGATISETLVYEWPTTNDDGSATMGWAGFANKNATLYSTDNPMTISVDSVISFEASVPSGVSADVYFKFEDDTHDSGNQNIVIETNSVTVSGDQTATYTVVVTSQGDTLFRNFLLYLDTQDVGVAVSNVSITEVSDSDGDGVKDNVDAFPNDSTESVDTDGDGVGNNADADDDGDGVADSVDYAPLDPAVTVAPDAQIVTVAGDHKVTLGEALSVEVSYDVNTGDATLTGLGLRVHFNSSQVIFNSMDHLTADNIGADGPFNDTDDFDGDANTDKYVQLSWAQPFAGAWPGQLPTTLVTLDLTVENTVVEGDTVTIGFSSNSNASGYAFIGDTVQIEVVTEGPTWDFDGNADADALTDGILLLRHAFGLRGDKLVVSEAVADNSTLSYVDIEANVEAAQAFADIDGDGSVDALSDGLLLLRHLFDITGDSLINAVVHPNGSRQTAAEVTTYMDQYMPAE